MPKFEHACSDLSEARNGRRPNVDGQRLHAKGGLDVEGICKGLFQHVRCKAPAET